MDTTCSTRTQNLTDDILSETVEIINARYSDDSVQDRVEGIMNEIMGILGPLVEGHVVLDVPSKAALQGDIALIGEKGKIITCTRPSDKLVQELKKVVNLAEFEDLWWPKSLIAWNYAILKRYLTRLESGYVLPEVFLSLARFGEAQLYGADEGVMHEVLKDMKSGRHRTHLQWREILIGDRLVEESYVTDFNGGIVRFVAKVLDGDIEFLIHELEFPISAQRVLQAVHQQIDNVHAWEIRKLHYQAFEKKVDIKDLTHDDMACPICMMEFENERNDKGKTRHTPLYDVMEDNRQPIELTCGHVFGTTCIEKWLTDNNNCPLCRATLIGRDRKLKAISQQSLANISTFCEGEAILYFEDIEFDQGVHGEIAKYVRTGGAFAWKLLERQFSSLLEIDARLGTSKRSSRSHTRAPRIARWMDEDWDRFATNVLALREHVKEVIRSSSDWVFDPLLKSIEMNLAKMLNFHRQRCLL
jgi:hypothetical protein